MRLLNAVIRPVQEPTNELSALSVAAYREGHRFVRRLLEEWRTGANRFSAPGEGLFVAEVGTAVVGVCGLTVDPFAGDPTVGRVRHLYVAPSFRRAGVGSELVSRVTHAARRGSFVRLRLRTGSREASDFYRACGFKPADGDTWTHELDLGGLQPN
jgi:GNAT superfamily N-acetyltransferase